MVTLLLLFLIAYIVLKLRDQKLLVSISSLSESSSDSR